MGSYSDQGHGVQIVGSRLCTTLPTSCSHHPRYPGLPAPTIPGTLDSPVLPALLLGCPRAVPALQPHCHWSSIGTRTVPQRGIPGTSLQHSLSPSPPFPWFHFHASLQRPWSLGVTLKKPSLNFTSACQESFPIPVTNISNIFRGPRLSQHAL